MEQKQGATTAADTKRFFDYVRELGKTVYRRINQAAKLKEFIELSNEMREKLAQKADIHLNAGLTFRDQCATIINSFSVLNFNIGRQKELAGDLMVIEAIDPRTEKRLMFKMLMLAESIQKGLERAVQIRERTNAITLLDYRIARHIARAGERVQEVAAAVDRLHASVSADWSGYCINEMEKEDEERLHARITAIIESGEIGDLAKMLEDVCAEIDAEKTLLASLTEQAPAAGSMSRSARDLFLDAASIRDLMEEKSALIRGNHEESAQLSVVLSLELADYLKIRDFLDPGEAGDDASDEARRKLEELGVLFDIAAGSIDNLIELNQYTVEISDTNVKRNDQMVELSNMLFHCHGSIRKESEAAEKLLAEAVKGSERNLIIGQALEKNIRKILESFGV